MELKIGDLDELMSKSVQCISVDGQKYVLIYHQQTLYALDDACPHKFASLSSGHLRGDKIVCPWHGAEFMITNGNCFSPLAPKGLKSYPITVRNNSVFIKLEDSENR